MFVKQTKENLFIWKPNNVGVHVDWSCKNPVQKIIEVVILKETI